jgi:hypothetical protein
MKILRMRRVVEMSRARKKMGLRRRVVEMRRISIPAAGSTAKAKILRRALKSRMSMPVVGTRIIIFSR